MRDDKQMKVDTFIIDCPWCKAKVAAKVVGVVTKIVRPGVEDGPSGDQLFVGACPRCGTPLAGESHQVSWEGQDWKGDVWSDVVRVYPKPARTFSSYRIPRVLADSLVEADKCLQAGAHTAACAMLGRALEALCRDILEPKTSAPIPTGSIPVPKKKIMLAEGIRRLKDGNFIDERLFDWSQQLHAFRNEAAHPGEASISRQDAEDLQTFVYAIVEFIYDLADRYDEFKARLEARTNSE